MLTSHMAHRSLDVLLARVEQEGRCSADEARELLASCEFGITVLERLWQLTQGFLDRGIGAKKLRSIVKEHLDVILVATKSFRAAAIKFGTSDLAAEEKTQAALILECASKRALTMHGELTTLLQWLDAPMRPIDASVLPPAVSAQNTPGYVPLDTLVKRLMSAGDS